MLYNIRRLPLTQPHLPIVELLPLQRAAPVQNITDMSIPMKIAALLNTGKEITHKAMVMRPQVPIIPGIQGMLKVC